MVVVRGGCVFCMVVCGDGSKCTSFISAHKQPELPLVGRKQHHMYHFKDMLVKDHCMNENLRKRIFLVVELVL